MVTRAARLVSLAFLCSAGAAMAQCGSSSDGSTPGVDGGGDGGGGRDATSDAGAANDSGEGADAGQVTDAGPPLVGAACTNPPCINVINNCAFPLWIHAKSNAGVTLTPDNAKLGTAGQADSVRQYDIPASWPAARVNAFWVDPGGATPDPNAYDKVELTVGGGTMNYNVTYVDYVALPARMEAIGPSCPKTGKFDPRVSCDVAAANLVAGCPAGLLDGKRCLSAGLYCSLPANAGTPFCHALDTTLQACEAQNPASCGFAGQLKNTTVDAYRCSGYFDSQPAQCSPASTTCHLGGNEWCAALNRGTLAQPTSTDVTQFYKTAPYNTYAKWVHDTCPGIYAFAYDDYPPGAGQSGFRACKADQLDITFCPGH